MFKGKAGSLRYLRDLGLKVPEWRVLKHVDIVSWGDQKLWKGHQDVEHFAQTIKVPEEILASLKDFLPVAVRSSASVEDSPDNSFAGIFETRLFVTADLERAIVDVWASLYSPSALKYCDERGIPYSQLGMDVIVQQMVVGEKSGVLFQADPLGFVNQQVIVAGWGLGQGIVDDITDTDKYVIAGSEIISSTIAHKQTCLSFEGKLVEKIVAPERSRISVLTEKDIDKLLGASEKVATGNDHFMDIEFTFAGSELYVLQARPITTIPTRKSLLIYDNSNIAENYPHQSLPLTYSALRRGYATNFKNLIAFLGFPAHERRALENKIDDLTGYWGGQIYYNLNNWYSVYGILPFGGKRAISSFNDMVGIRSDGHLQVPERSVLASLHIALKVLPKFAAYYFKTKSHHEAYKRDFRTLYLEVRAKSPEARSALELIDLLQDFDTRYLDLIKIPLFNDFFSSILNHACRSLAVAIAGKEGEGLYNDLLSHREELESSKAIYSLIDLSQAVARDPNLMDFLDRQKASPDVLERLKSYPDFHRSLSLHFDRFGDRSQWEMKVEVPTARENPETTLKLILNYARSGLSPEEQKRRERDKTERARTELNRHLSRHPLKAALFNLLFKKCTEALCFREDSRFDRVRYKGLSRKLLLNLGEVLARKNILAASEDIFFLTWEEILALRHDSFGQGYHGELVALRKKHLGKLKDLSLPDRIVVNDITAVEKFNQASVPEARDKLFGIPCSGGTVEAECVVVHDLNEAPDLNGKILIAKRTDPAWGYFFVGVKGIIIEKGSMLSHAAIISRELGIPCVINVASATALFKSGMRMRLNGDTGEIAILGKDSI